jgi:hypothetical protein
VIICVPHDACSRAFPANSILIESSAYIRACPVGNVTPGLRSITRLLATPRGGRGSIPRSKPCPVPLGTNPLLRFPARRITSPKSASRSPGSRTVFADRRLMNGDLRAGEFTKAELHTPVKVLMFPEPETLQCHRFEAR